MKEALGSSIAEIISHKHEDYNANEIGNDRYRDGGERNHKECDGIGAVPQIKVENTQRCQGDNGVEPRARSGNEQLILPNLDCHSGAGDRIAQQI